MSSNKKIRFNNRHVERLAAPPATSDAKAIEYSDTQVPGLKLEVTKQGTRTFRFRYTYRGQKRSYRIGTFPATDVEAARQRALELRGQLDRGNDPMEAKDREKAMPTFGDFARDEYLPYVRTVKASYRADESKLRNHLVPLWGSRRLCDITLRDVQTYHAKVKESHCAATANRHLSLLSKMFSLAMEWERVDKNPCGKVKAFRETNVRERTLDVEEIGRLYRAMKSEPNRVAVAAIKLLLLTGVRRQEALEARWENVDLEGSTLFLPKTKNGKSRYVPLNDAAVELLREQNSRGRSPWVFPGDDTDRPIVNLTKPFGRILKKAGLGHMRIHDLRHSFASLLANRGFNEYQLQKLLGHSTPRVTQRYVHMADQSLRNASQALADLVTEAVADRMAS